ncbi:MAG: hypothetical protein OSB19_03725 [Opitutaceae bacterium]|nr:hypothetical protein [Opitutaceae bacterium]
MYEYSHFSFLTCLASSLGLLLFFASGNGAKPNIIVILADDMGYTNIGCYGGENRHAASG